LLNGTDQKVKLESNDLGDVIVDREGLMKLGGLMLVSEKAADS
jgi:hypothetical protein